MYDAKLAVISPEKSGGGTFFVEGLNILLALKKNNEENRANTEQTKEFYASLNSEQQKAIDKILLDLKAKVISEVEAQFRSEIILTTSQHDNLKELLDWHNRLAEKSSELRRQVQSFQNRRCQVYDQQPIEICN